VLVTEPQRHTLADLFSSEVCYPPLFYLPAVATQHLAGGAGVRAVLFGLLPFFVLLNVGLYILARRIYGAGEIGLWASALLPLSPMFATVWGLYNPLFALVALFPLLVAAFVGARTLQDRPRVVLFFGLLGVAFLTYMWAPLLLWLPAVVYFGRHLATGPDRPTKWANAGLGAAVFLGLAATFVLQPEIWRWFTVSVPLMFHPESTESHDMWVGLGGRLFPLRQLPGALGGTLGIAAAWGLLRWNRRRPEEGTLVLAAVGVVLAIVPFAQPQPIRLLPVVVLACVLAAAGIVRTFPGFARGSVLAVVLAATVLLRLPTLAARSPEWNEPDLRPLMTALERECGRTRVFRLFCPDQGVFGTLEYFATTAAPTTCLARRLGDISRRRVPAVDYFSHYLVYDDLPRHVVDFAPLNPRLPEEYARFLRARSSLRTVYADATLLFGTPLELLADPKAYRDDAASPGAGTIATPVSASEAK
jgi:hypothetical protein